MLAKTVEIIGTWAAVALILAAGVAYLAISTIVTQRRFSQFPGPPLAGYTRLWMFRQWLGARFHFAQAEALKKYGSPCRIAPDLVIVDDADAIRHIAGPRSAWTRSAWYDTNKFDKREHTVFSTRDEKQHAELRAKEIGAYNGRDLDLEAEIDTTIQELTDLIERSYLGRPLELAQVTRFFTLDTLSRLVYGESFGNLPANKDVYNFGESVAGFLPVAELIQNHEWVARIISHPLVQKALTPKDAEVVGIGKIVSFAKERVAQRFKNDEKDRRDMLGYFMSKGLSQEQCEVEAPLQIFAGSDSTSTVFRNTMFLLAGNARAYGQLRSEVDNAVAGGQISDPVSYEATKKLQYLEACIWEGIRMYPPLFGLKTKLPPKGGDTIKGIFYPDGIQVGFCDSGLCRKESEWGSDADQFRPDRWMGADESTRQRYETIVSCIFGSGKYTCLGKHIAFMELRKVMFEMMRKFDWSITDPMRGVDMYGYGAWVQKNMLVTPRLR